jgi:hypothetical protein
MDKFEIKLFRNSESIVGTFELSKDASLCKLKLTFNIDNKLIVEESDATDFFSGLLEIREKLDAKKIYVGCTGARKDFYPSRMAIQMSDGRVGYLLEPGKGSKTKAKTFDKFEDTHLLATVDEQRIFFTDWCNSFRNS